MTLSVAAVPSCIILNDCLTTGSKR